MALTIKHINTTFECMNKRTTELGIQSMVVNAPVVAVVAHTSVETDLFSFDPIFIGRDDDLPKLVHVLTHTHLGEEKRMFSIIALLGMGYGEDYVD